MDIGGWTGVRTGVNLGKNECLRQMNWEGRYARNTLQNAENSNASRV